MGDGRVGGWVCEGLEGFEVWAGKGWVEGWAYDFLQYMYFPCKKDTK